MRNGKNTKMDDNYPRVFFRCGMVLSLIASDDWISDGLFLPGVLLNSYFYVTQSRKQTLELCTIAFFYVRKVLKQQSRHTY